MAREKKPTPPTTISEGRARRKPIPVGEPVNQTNGGLEEAIRARAYELYVERGRVDGQDQDDWVRAEREILAQTGKRSA